jgi:hypothetical protein
VIITDDLAKAFYLLLAAHDFVHFGDVFLNVGAHVVPLCVIFLQLIQLAGIGSNLPVLR